MVIRVRWAEPADVGWVVDQLRVFSPMFGTKKAMFGDPKFVEAGMLDMIENHVCWIAETAEVTQSRGDSIGFISGYSTTHPYNPEIKIVSEQFWWVPIEHRHTTAAAQLLNTMIDWGKANVDWIFISTQAETEIKDSSLISMGFKERERTFLMEVDHG